MTARTAPVGFWAYFVRAARPTGMWVCVLALFVQLVCVPAAWICGVTTPEPDVAQLVVLAISLLGLGAMRSIDKQQGNAT